MGHLTGSTGEHLSDSLKSSFTKQWPVIGLLRWEFSSAGSSSETSLSELIIRKLFSAVHQKAPQDYFFHSLRPPVIKNQNIVDLVIFCVAVTAGNRCQCPGRYYYEAENRPVPPPAVAIN